LFGELLHVFSLVVVGVVFGLTTAPAHGGVTLPAVLTAGIMDLVAVLGRIPSSLAVHAFRLFADLAAVLAVDADESAHAVPAGLRHRIVGAMAMHGLHVLNELRAAPGVPLPHVAFIFGVPNKNGFDPTGVEFLVASELHMALTFGFDMGFRLGVRVVRGAVEEDGLAPFVSLHHH